MLCRAVRTVPDVEVAVSGLLQLVGDAHRHGPRHRGRHRRLGGVGAQRLGAADADAPDANANEPERPRLGVGVGGERVRRPDRRGREPSRSWSRSSRGDTDAPQAAYGTR